MVKTAKRKISTRGAEIVLEKNNKKSKNDSCDQGNKKKILNIPIVVVSHKSRDQQNTLRISNLLKSTLEKEKINKEINHLHSDTFTSLESKYAPRVESDLYLSDEDITTFTTWLDGRVDNPLKGHQAICISELRVLVKVVLLVSSSSLEDIKLKYSINLLNLHQ